MPISLVNKFQRACHLLSHTSENSQVPRFSAWPFSPLCICLRSDFSLLTFHICSDSYIILKSFKNVFVRFLKRYSYHPTSGWSLLKENFFLLCVLLLYFVVIGFLFTIWICSTWTDSESIDSKKFMNQLIYWSKIVPHWW